MRGKRKQVRRVFRRIGLYWKKRYRKVTVRRGIWRVRIKRRVCRIKRRGRNWYYRRGRKWRRLSRPRFVLRYKRKRRRLVRRYGRWRFRVRKRWTKLIGRVRRFILVRGKRRLLKRRGGRRYSVLKRNGRLSRPKRVRRFFGLISEYNISCSTKRFTLSW